MSTEMHARSRILRILTVGPASVEIGIDRRLDPLGCALTLPQLLGAAWAREGRRAMAPTATPRREGTVRLRDGRTLAYAEWGDLTRHPAPRPPPARACSARTRKEATSAAGVRLLTLDRPVRLTPRSRRPCCGGQTTIVPSPRAELGLPPSPVVGWSAGGAARRCVGGVSPAPDDDHPGCHRVWTHGSVADMERVVGPGQTPP